MTNGTAKNTDTEIWRKSTGDFYSPSICVTQDGQIGINVGGTVYVRSIEHWHSLAAYNVEAIKQLYEKFQAEDHDNQIAKQIFQPHNWKSFTTLVPATTTTPYPQPAPHAG